jgi:hypothetical protein
MSFTPRRSAVGFAKEVARGTAVSPAYWVPFTSMGLTDQPEHAIDDSAFGVLEDAIGDDVVYNSASGPLEGRIYDNSIGLLLLNVFGAVTTTADADASGDVNDHAFSVAQNNAHPSLTLSEKNPITDVQYALAMISKLTIKAVAKQHATFSADLMSKASAAVGSPSTPAIVEGNRFIPSGIFLYMADTVAGLDAASAIPLSSITATFDLGVQDDPDVLGALTPLDLYNTTFKSTVEIEGLYRDDSLRQLVLNGTKKAVRLRLSNRSKTIGTAAHPTLDFDFQPGFFNPWSKSTGINDLVSQQTTFNGMYSTSASKSVSAKLTNLVESYA